AIRAGNGFASRWICPARSSGFARGKRNWGAEGSTCWAQTIQRTHPTCAESAVLERARDYMQENRTAFGEALAITRAGNLFTTHTPVAAGFDRFAPGLMKKYFRNYAEQELEIGLEDLLALGRQNHGDSNEPFNMAYLAIRGSGAVNAVSKL